MTEPVSKIGATKETGRKNRQEEYLRHDQTRHHPEQRENDSVDISEEARDRASGKRKKNILEYIESQNS
jgi:hypothetical protein